jgi:hypothetical protein
VAATSIRWAVVENIVTQLQAAVTTANDTLLVSAFWPGEMAATAEMIFTDTIASEVDVPTMTGGRLHRDDIFTIQTWALVAGRADMDATMTRLEVIVGYVENLLASDHTLDAMDGVLSVELTSVTVEGARTPDGFHASAQMSIRVHSRLV